MSVDDYRQAGYLMSVHLTQAIVDRAERDVTEAYLEPLGVEIDTISDGIGRETLMQLAYTLCLQRTIFATRSGAKEKTTPQSQTADRWAILSEDAGTCAMKMQRLADALGVVRWWDKVTDICGILFKTQYIGL